jgi:hypothetical protein
MIKINDVIEKTLFRSMIIKDLMQKLTIVKKRKKKHIIRETFVQRRLEAADKHEKSERTNEKELCINIRYQFFDDDDKTNVCRNNARYAQENH